MKDMNRSKWSEMSHIEKSLWLEGNYPVNERSLFLRGSVHGAGINDSNYITQPRIGGKQFTCPAYNLWQGILSRAYSDKSHKKHPTYIGVTVCDEWLSFSAFRAWWIKNYVEDCEIDKDIIGSGKVYSPDGCLFVPAWLNTFILDARASRGEWPIGVYFDSESGKFMAQCRNPITRKNKKLGRFKDPLEAHEAWRARKIEMAGDLKCKMDDIDIHIYPRIVDIINGLK